MSKDQELAQLFKELALLAVAWLSMLLMYGQLVVSRSFLGMDLIRSLESWFSYLQADYLRICKDPPNFCSYFLIH